MNIFRDICHFFIHGAKNAIWKTTYERRDHWYVSLFHMMWQTGSGMQHIVICEYSHVIMMWHVIQHMSVQITCFRNFEVTCNYDVTVTTFSEFWYSNIEASPSHTTTYVKFGSIEREEPILFIRTQNFVVQIWVIRAKSPQNLVFNTSFSRFLSLLRTRFDFQKIVMSQWVLSRKFCWKIGMLQCHPAKTEFRQRV